MRATTVGMLLVPALLLAGCGQLPQKHAASGRTWWYHGYPPHDEIPLPGRIGAVALGFGKVWAVASDARGPRLVRIDHRRDEPERHASLAVFDASLVAGAGRVWTLADGVLLGTSPRTLRPRSRTVLHGPADEQPRLLATGGGSVWAANAGNLAAARPGAGRLWRVDSSGRVVARVALPVAPLALAAGGGRLWIADTAGDLRAVDLGANRLLPGRLRLGSFPPAALAATRDRVWVAAPDGLIEIDARRLAVVRRLGFRAPLNPEITASGRWIWVSDARDYVYRVHAATGRPGRPIRLRGHRVLLAAPGLLWSASAHAVLRIASWRGWDAHPEAPRCSSRQLRASAFFQGATGSYAGGLRLVNTSTSACTLAGYPPLRLTDALGRPLPIAVVHARPRWEFSTAPGNWPYQTLKPGRASGFDIWWMNWCGRPATVVFHVQLPGGTLRATAASGPRCDAPGSPSTMSVSQYGAEFGS